MTKPWIIGRKERRGLLTAEPNMMNAYNSVETQHRIAKGNHKDIEKAIAIGRKFNDEVIRPMALDLELKLMQEHNYLPWDFVKKAAEWGLFSLFLPKLYGGGGLNFIAIYPFAEEISAACTGLGHVIMGHYCGCGTIFPSMNSRLLYKVYSDVCRSEKKGDPHLLTLVVTEPTSGTDIQEPLLIHHAKTQSSIERVKGGFVVNGRKIFITNGLLSYWHLCHFWEDKNNKAETWVQCLVNNGTKGFSFGTHEKKMGQLACTAAELIFEDCFIPDNMVTFRAQDPELKHSKKGPKWISHTVVDLVTQNTRTGTAAISTGMARNAYETAREYARKKKVGNELLINHQWAQIILTDMYRNVNMSRLVYMESANAMALSGIFKLLFIKPLYYYLKIMPKWFFKLISPIFKLKIASSFFRAVYFHRFTNEERNATSGWASFCKYTCSDIGVVNTNLALDLMGADGLRHDQGAEKCFRDIKLQQIYESTNQVNQMNMFYCLVANNLPEVEFFK